MAEIWKTVEPHPSYEVSTYGNVRRGAKILKHLIGTHGYPVVTLYRQPPMRKVVLVHALVLEAFVGPCPSGMQARHYPDRTKTNVCLDNLQWGTPAEDSKDQVKHGTRVRGEMRSKYPEGHIHRMFDLRRCGCTQQEIASWFGTSQGYISQILSGSRWAHLSLAN